MSCRGTHARVLARLAKVDVLVIDDWGLAPLKEQERRDMLEILEDRYGNRSTLMTIISTSRRSRAMNSGTLVGKWIPGMPSNR
ncbi:MAG TPA: ATP-binding protein [Archangium sp.]|uniref:ATP-binding protein n=1 Tax=Archangium sp. TaxID=1872627 RepID=UPI002E381DFE|nr:ATP-binding protein [Archangium sp.]HEX5751994.1 ATP-binding protein [Archangium sp.]